jgi:hypothetical protein
MITKKLRKNNQDDWIMPANEVKDRDEPVTDQRILTRAGPYKKGQR